MIIIHHRPPLAAAPRTTAPAPNTPSQPAHRPAHRLSHFPGAWACRLARRSGTWLTLLALLLLGSAAQAQFIDDVELRRDGPDAVLLVRFVTAVQFQRVLLGASADQSLVYYRLLPTQQAPATGLAERRFRPPVGSKVPEVTVSDDEASARNRDERRLRVRLSSPVKHRVRAGRGDRSIEIVLEGLGAQVQAAPASELVPGPAGRLSVTLEATEQPGAYLSAAIPASLQNVNVYTTRRVVRGKVMHETHLGPFDSRAEAEAALRAVRGRFPQAVLAQGADLARPAVVATAAAASAPLAASPVEASPMAAAPSTAATPAVSDAEREQQAAALLSSAREALASGAAQTAVELLARVLDLPPQGSSRAAQALIGQARLQAGDTARARAEFEAFLRLYPQGADSQAVRTALAALAPASAMPPEPAPTALRVATTTLSGSVNSYYYGGQSRVRTQEFQDSIIGGVPELISDATLSDTDQSLLVSGVDINWRHRDADVDRRFVFRNTYSKDFNRPEKSRNRLSALYVDQRSFANGTSFRIGRQTPQGGGVLGRFDGVQAGYAFLPRWKAVVVAGVPSDPLLDAKRLFYGASVEAEALLPQLGGSLYLMEQKIDGYVDRRALGTELRYFDGGLSASGQLDYDLALKGLNIASFQSTWQRPDNTVFNLLFDRRDTPLLMLGNALFFPGSTLTPPSRITDIVNAGTPVQTLRQQVRDTTAKSTQGSIGVTTPLNTHWQVGTDLRYTNTGAIAPVPELLPLGQASSGDIWSLSLQFIGTNLYSARDTHVLIANFVNGPNFQGQLLSYNHSSLVWQAWQLEPSIKLYRQVSNDNVRSTRWSPGLRVTYRVRQEIALESEVTMENSKTTSPLRNESSTRSYYYMGARYEF